MNGKSIQTSIDIGAQQIVEKYVNGFKEAMGAKNIGVIVENPSTGEIIAMDGGDRYDLNNPRDLSTVYTEDEIKRRLGIFLVDTWDEENQKIVKKTNKTISTIPNRTKKE